VAVHALAHSGSGGGLESYVGIVSNSVADQKMIELVSRLIVAGGSKMCFGGQGKKIRDIFVIKSRLDVVTETVLELVAEVQSLQNAMDEALEKDKLAYTWAVLEYQMHSSVPKIMPHCFTGEPESGRCQKVTPCASGYGPSCAFNKPAKLIPLPPEMIAETKAEAAARKAKPGAKRLTNNSTYSKES